MSNIQSFLCLGNVLYVWNDNYSIERERERKREKRKKRRKDLSSQKMNREIGGGPATLKRV